MTAELDSTDVAPDSARASKPTEKSLLYYIGLAVSLVALLIVVAIALAAIIVPMATGSTALTVLTSSMEPRYPAGTLIVVRPVAAADVQVGDVVTYQSKSGQPQVVTHRVIEKGFRQDGGLQFITQGDANSVADENPVREVQIQGRLWYSVPYLGWVANAMNGSARQTIVPVIAGLLVAYGVWSVGSGIVQKRKRSRTSASETTRTV